MPVSTTCPKCGQTDLYIAFKAKGTRLWDKEAKICQEFCDNQNTITDGMRFTDDKVVKECLYVQCRTCQYSWAENTMEEE